ncbi:MAG: hypothetical protein Q7J29_01635 [Stagnimonas sp.]|nr:hypothetical protein [Stagnimonas sp.]
MDNDLLRRVHEEPQRLWASVASFQGGLISRQVSMLSFAVNVWLSDMNPVAFKLTNVLIHLLCGLLVYRLALRVIAALAPPTRHGMPLFNVELWAALAAGLWLLHPLHISSVLYVVQRMTLLASLFGLLSLLCYCEVRLRQINGGPAPWKACIGVVVFAVLSVFSKENGALLPLFALTLELFAFRFAAQKPLVSSLLRWGYGLGLAIAVFGISAYLAFTPSFFNGYEHRDFTLAERLMTQPRVLWHYLLWTVLPNPAWLSLYHDDIATSHALLAPVSTLFALLGLLALVAVAWVFRRRQPALGFAITWFLLGHTMESTFIPLEMVFEHRQYFPMIGIWIGFAAWAAVSTRQTPVAVAASVLMLGFCLTAGYRAWVWNDPARLIMTTAQQHPNSSRSQYDAGRFLLDNTTALAARQAILPEARRYLERAMQLNGKDINPITAMVLSYPPTAPPPDVWLEQLRLCLQNAPKLSPAPFLLVVRSAANLQVNIPPEKMAALVQASLSNTSMELVQHGLVLSNYGYYLLKVANDPVEAVSATMSAISLEPRRALFHLNAAYLSYELADFSTARLHLRNATVTDGDGSYRDQITALQEKMDAAARAAP